jgi:hypothetical protein
LRDGLLRKLAAGESVMALAWQETAGDIDVDGLAVTATPFEAGYNSTA